MRYHPRIYRLQVVVALVTVMRTLLVRLTPHRTLKMMIPRLVVVMMMMMMMVMRVNQRRQSNQKVVLGV
jgi:hypothetical protein